MSRDKSQDIEEYLLPVPPERWLCCYMVDLTVILRVLRASAASLALPSTSTRQHFVTPDQLWRQLKRKNSFVLIFVDIVTVDDAELIIILGSSAIVPDRPQPHCVPKYGHHRKQGEEILERRRVAVWKNMRIHRKGRGSKGWCSRPNYCGQKETCTSTCGVCCRPWHACRRSVRLQRYSGNPCCSTSNGHWGGST